MGAFVPAEVFPPGVFIKEELAARGWTQADLAEIMERPVQMVNEIVRAKKRVTEETAKELEAAFGIEAEFWTRSEALYRLRNSDPAPTTIARRAAIRKRVPLRLMTARGWLPASADVPELEVAVKDYLRIQSLEERAPFSMAAKQTSYEEELSATQEVWLFRVRQIAETMVIPNYSPIKLRQVIAQLRGLLASPEDVRHVPRLLAEAGVRLVVVERLPGLKIDGVCFWLSPTQPVIGMSLTRDRIDNFWFVVRHEIEHVLNGDGSDGTVVIVDNDLDDARDVSERERRANAAAAEFCVPSEEMEDFIKRKNPLFTDENIRAFAATVGRHSGLVAGQLRKRLSAGSLGEKAWARFTSHLAKVRYAILETALVDGFGSSLQSGLPKTGVVHQ